MRKLFCLIIFALCFFNRHSYAQITDSDFNQYGGWKAIQEEAKGHFHLKEINGVWWMVDPEGNVFLSIGVNHIASEGDQISNGVYPYHQAVEQKYNDDIDVWREAVFNRLFSWNFNTVGAFSSEVIDKTMPYTDMTQYKTNDYSDEYNWMNGLPIRVFSQEFRSQVDSRIRPIIYRQKNPKYLLGYFSNNEIRWGPDWRSSKSLLLDFIEYDSDDRESFDAAIQFLRDKYQTIQNLNQQWYINASTFNTISYETAFFPPSESRTEAEEEFLRLYAKTYFKTIREAIDQYMPDALYLGARFAGDIPKPVLEVMGEYVDIVCLNSYEHAPPIEQLNEIHEITGRPVMITEFSFAAMDSGLPNLWGPGVPVATQADRARLYKEYVEKLMNLPYVVGYHWYQHVDQPIEGRFDRQSHNYGLVKINDDPWEELVQTATEMNRRAYEIHKDAVNSGVEDWLKNERSVED
ncbi:beta-agarase [bacterium]|nr:beta-agarase [bacterium]